MKIEKYELVRAIDKVKGVVVKNDNFPALEGALIKDGYLTASNMELTVQVKLEGAVSEEFLLPMQSFDLIKNLPDGELELVPNTAGDMITIRTGKITNSYQTLRPDTFSFYRAEASEANRFTLPAEVIMKAFGHVLFAAADKSSRKGMTGIYLQGHGSEIDVVALDGHVIAWERIEAGGDLDMKLIIPKNAVRKLLAIGLEDNIEISYSLNSASFSTDDFKIYTRLIDGNYFTYEKMFGTGTLGASIAKKDMADAMVRAKMCVDENTPVVFDLEDSNLKISAKSRYGHYAEDIEMLTAIQKPLRIGFSSKLVLDAVRSFTCGKIYMEYIGADAPMVMRAEDSDMRVAVLPVRLSNTGAS